MRFSEWKSVLPEKEDITGNDRTLFGKEFKNHITKIKNWNSKQ